jgi:hypothetical protein
VPLSSEGGTIQVQYGTLAVNGRFITTANAMTTKSGAGKLAIAGPHFHAAGATFIAAEGLTEFATDAAGLAVDSRSSVHFGASQHLAGLTVAAGAQATLAPGTGALVTESLSVDPDGKLDLNDNDMVVSGGMTQSAIVASIRTARNGGAWTGAGITSSSAKTQPNHATTLGVLSGAEYHGINGATANFDGVAVNNSDVLVKYTWYGDADFNGKVNFDDYVKTDNGFNNHLTGWTNARPGEKINWVIDNGAMTNTPKDKDIGTAEKFQDFDLQLEYKTVKGGNSGVYLRGRIELQVLDSFGKTDISTGSDGGIYGQHAPLVNASKPVGEWIVLEATIVGDTLTAKLNNKLIHDKVKLTEVTGGALPGSVTDPGPLMLQGDHGKVWYRNIRIRPIAAGTGAAPEKK